MGETLAVRTTLSSWPHPLPPVLKCCANVPLKLIFLLIITTFFLSAVKTRPAIGKNRAWEQQTRFNP